MTKELVLRRMSERRGRLRARRRKVAARKKLAIENSQLLLQRRRRDELARVVGARSRSFFTARDGAPRPPRRSTVFDRLKSGVKRIFS